MYFEVLSSSRLIDGLPKASARAGIAVLEASDAELAKAQQLQAENVNSPRLGDGHNYAFGGIQMNLAATQDVSSGSGQLLQIHFFSGSDKVKRISVGRNGIVWSSACG